MRYSRPEIGSHPRRRWPASSRKSLAAILSDCLIGAVGFLTCVRLRLVGDIYIGELLMAAMLPIVLVFRKQLSAGLGVARLLGLLSLWLLSQVVTDAYREIDFADRMRGMAAIMFLAIEIAFLLKVVAGSDRRKIIFLTARAVGSIAMARIQPMAFASKDPWKFGYASGTIILAVLMSCFFYARRKYAFALLALGGIMAVNLLLNFRSAFLDLLVATVLIFPIIPSHVGRFRILPQKVTLLRVSMTAGLALGAVWCAGKIVHIVTHSDFLTQEAQEKNESEANAGNLLLGGRPEFFVGLRAAMDSPIIGHGSWAKDMKYIEMQNDLMEEYGADVDLTDIETEDLGLIPAHSHIVGAWVWAGILGAVFWAYAIWLVIRALIVVSIQRPRLAPIYAFLLVLAFWEILFSPFGGTGRVTQAFTIMIAVDLLGGQVKRPRLIKDSSAPFPSSAYIVSRRPPRLRRG